MKKESQFHKSRRGKGEVVMGGYFVFRRGKSTGRVRFKLSDGQKIHQPFEHGSQGAAETEAYRLSQRYPEEAFYVFAQISGPITRAKEGGDVE